MGRQRERLFVRCQLRKRKHDGAGALGILQQSLQNSWLKNFRNMAYFQKKFAIEIEVCQDCLQLGKPGKLSLGTDLTPGNMGWRCSSCPKKIPIRKALAGADREMWLDQVPIRKYVCALWHFCKGKNVAEVLMRVNNLMRNLQFILR